MLDINLRCTLPSRQRACTHSSCHHGCSPMIVPSNELSIICQPLRLSALPNHEKASDGTCFASDDDLISALANPLDGQDSNLFELE